MTGSVLVVGSLQVVIRAEVDGVPVVGGTVTASSAHRTVGGRGADQAVAARRAGARVSLVAAVGDDDAGRWCEDHLVRLGIEPRLQVVPGEATATRVVMTEGPGRDAALLLDGATARLDGRAALVRRRRRRRAPRPARCTRAGRRGPVARGRPAPAARRRQRVTVRGARAGRRDGRRPVRPGGDAALLGDAGLIPASLCVTFGRSGAVWDGMRVDSDDYGAPALADGGTEAFCGTLAAGLAAGHDRRVALRAAVVASALTDW